MKHPRIGHAHHPKRHRRPVRPAPRAQDAFVVRRKPRFTSMRRGLRAGPESATAGVNAQPSGIAIARKPDPRLERCRSPTVHPRRRRPPLAPSRRACRRHRLTRHFTPKASRSRAPRAVSSARQGSVRPASTSSAIAAASVRHSRRRGRRPSPVIGSTKPAASPASSRPGTPAAATSTASGPRPDRRSRAGRAKRGEPRIGGERRVEQRSRIAHSAAAARRYETRVGEAAGHRRHADVDAATNVHLAHRRQPVDTVEVGADRPAAWSRRLSREPSAEGYRRSRPRHGDGDRGAKHAHTTIAPAPTRRP